jgi:metallophosphoesterase superfamily enzyme
MFRKVKNNQKVESAWDEYSPEDSILVIGDIHCISSRVKAMECAQDSIFLNIKDRKFSKIVLLGDLFEDKPTTQERILLAQFLKKLRNYSSQLHFIIGNGKHTFEAGQIYEQDWIELCPDFYQHDELILGNFVFGHYEVKGTKYINGFVSNSEQEIDPSKTYVLGHVHQPACSFKNFNYVGSIYKTDFSEINDEKRICIIEKGNLIWYPIKSRPMYQVKLLGQNGEVKVSNEVKEFLQKTPEKTEMDIKVIAETDMQSIGAINRHISRIKEKFSVEYYQQSIEVKDSKVDVPENLDKTSLLKNYCEKKNVPYAQVAKELQ